MRVLALDLAATIGSLAIVDGDRILAEELIESPDGFAHLIIDRIADLLAHTSLGLDDFDCFVAACGPGSFTGVRVGLATVKGFAEAIGRPAFGISNLRAVASTGSAAVRIPILDARRGDVFIALGGTESTGKLTEFLPAIEKLNGYEFVTPDPDWLRSLLPAEWAESPIVPSPAALAASIGRCAIEDIEGGASGDPALLDATYVRRADAERAW